jgi:hypothetical protein
MKRYVILVLLFAGQATFAQTASTVFGKPLFWYRVSNPWSAFMGAEGPVIILYDDGKILNWRNGAYHLTELDPGEKSQLLDELGLTDTIFQKSRYLNATDPGPNGEIMATDNPVYTVFVKRDTLIRVSVYGSIAIKSYRKRFPPQILRIHNFVLNFDDEKSSIWVPDRVEVLLSDYGNASDTSIPWPAGWPDLNSPETKKKGDYVTSIFLNKKYLSRLIWIIKKRREKQAFEINGRKFFVGYRFPLPGLY